MRSYKLTLALPLLLALLCSTPALASKERIFYGFHESFAPLSYVENGQPKGFEFELLRAALETSDFEIVPRPMSWDMILLGLRQGGIHITSGMARTPRREKIFLFSKRPSIPMVTRIIQNTRNGIKSFQQLRGQKVAVKRDSLYQYDVEKLRLSLDIQLFHSHQQALEALYNGAVSAYGGGDKIADHIIRTGNLGGLCAIGPPLGVTMLHFALRQDQKMLKEQLDKGMARLWNEGIYDKLYRKWFVKELKEQEIAKLIALAKEGAHTSYVPYTLTPQGAAVLTASGNYYSGGKVENGLPSLTSSALRVAVQRAVSNGDTELRAALCLSSNGRVTPPDADDRRLLLQFGRGVLAVTEPDPKSYETRMAPELLPKETGFLPWDGLN